LYGTPKKWIEESRAKGLDLVLEIDVRRGSGKREAARIRAIFILPPSRAELERRLRSRGQDSTKEIARRLAKARQRSKRSASKRLSVVNEDVERAGREVESIVTRCGARVRAAARWWKIFLWRHLEGQIDNDGADQSSESQFAYVVLAARRARHDGQCAAAGGKSAHAEVQRAWRVKKSITAWSEYEFNPGTIRKQTRTATSGVSSTPRTFPSYYAWRYWRGTAYKAAELVRRLQQDASRCRS